MFGGMISESTPHLYISALSFSPESSIIYKTFAPEFSQVVLVTSGHITAWPMCQSVLLGHTDLVTSVAFSPDGKHIISGSSDKTIQMWDAETGKAVGAPFKGHTGQVNSVAFSPDGKHIISGCRN